MNAFAALAGGAGVDPEAPAVADDAGVGAGSAGSSPPQPEAATTSAARTASAFTPPRLRGVQLPRDQLERAGTAAPDHRERAAGADPLLGHEPLQVVDAAHGEAVDADDQVLGPHAGAVGGRAVDHLDDFDRAVAAERGGHTRRQRPGAAGDPDPRPAHPTVAHER